MGKPPHGAHDAGLYVYGGTGVHDRGLLEHEGGQLGYCHIHWNSWKLIEMQRRLDFSI